MIFRQSLSNIVISLCLDMSDEDIIFIYNNSYKLIKILFNDLAANARYF